MRYLFGLLLIIPLQGCGYKGPLYLPNEPAKIEKPKDDPAKMPPIESRIP